MVGVSRQGGDTESGEMAAELTEDLEKLTQAELHSRLMRVMALDVDEKYFSSVFFSRTFQEVKTCKECGFRGIMKKPARSYEVNTYGTGLEIFVTDMGIVGKHQLECPKCAKMDAVWSYDTQEPPSNTHSIFGLQVRYYTRKITHTTVLHDVMDLMKIEQMDNISKKKKRYEEIGEFMLKNARRVCDEWCSPDNAKLRKTKLIQLYDDTIFSIDQKPSYPSYMSEDNREIYDTTLESFLQNVDKAESLLKLLKETLFDHPSRPVFMVWLCIAMTQVELFSMLIKFYDPKVFMDSGDQEFINVRHQYKTLNMPKEIKKIPVALMLNEMPRFFHYADFLRLRTGQKSFSTKDSDVDRIIGSCLSREGLKMAMGGAQGRKILKCAIQQSRTAKKKMLKANAVSCLNYVEHIDDFEKEFVMKFNKLSLIDQYTMCIRSIRTTENFPDMQCETELPTPLMFKGLFKNPISTEVIVDDEQTPFKNLPNKHRDMKETLDMLTKKSQSIVLGAPLEEEMMEMCMNGDLRSSMLSDREQKGSEVPVKSKKPPSETSSDEEDETINQPPRLPLDDIMDRVRETLQEHNISIPEKYMPRPVTIPSELVPSANNEGNESLQGLMLPMPVAGSKDAEDLAKSMSQCQEFYSKESSEWADSILKTRNVYTLHVPTTGIRNPDGKLQVTPQMFYHGRETLDRTLKNLDNHAHVARMAAAVLPESTDETIHLSASSEVEKPSTPCKKKGKIPRSCNQCGSSPEKLLTCKACRSVAYCSTTCQRAHWKVHKKNCTKQQ